MSFILFRVHELSNSSRNESPDSTGAASTYIEVPSTFQASAEVVDDSVSVRNLAYNVGMTSSAAPHPENFIVVFMTAPDGESAGRIAHNLVEEGLVACVNIVPGVRSIYRWEGKLCDDSEVLCLCKTRAEKFAAVRERISSLHPYSVPEIIAVPLTAGSAAYLDWVARSTEARVP